MIINSLKLRENLFSPECNKPLLTLVGGYTACSRRQTQDTNSVLGFLVHLVRFYPINAPRKTTTLVFQTVSK